MIRTKREWIDLFRKEADQVLGTLRTSRKDAKSKASTVNRELTALRENYIEQIKRTSKKESWSNEKTVNEIMLLTYASYIVMLEARNEVWPYEYMAFARRIGELWEPFCKLTFQYPVKNLKLIEPPNFNTVQDDIKETANKYIDSLNVNSHERRLLKYYYSIPWKMVDSGGIKLDLDLHFEQDGIRYNCDFKSGFSSNEKGNTNRLLLVASIYHSLNDKERTLLFVRQSEDENNHYLQTLKNSQYWEVHCANDCYAAIKKFTGIDIRNWLDTNVDWVNDITPEFATHLKANDLLKYLTW